MRFARRPLAAPTSPWLLAFALLPAALTSQEPRRSERFSGPPRDPPSRDFDFLHLRLECSFDWESEAVSGRATHTMRAFRDGARSVELDQVGIDVRSATLANGQALSFETLPEKLRVDLGREARRGEEITLALEYRARPKQGVYFRKPDASYPDTPIEVWTQGEAEEARHWIPCFDHPSDKLTTEVLVTAPRPMAAISNGRLLSVEPRGEGAQVFHWSQEKPHATYLIVVAVGEFAAWKGDFDGIPLAAYVPKKHEALAARSFELTPDMMAFFGERTGVRYPWPKYDQICVSGFLFGGMENTSATTLNENTLHDERAALDVSSLGLVAHELAHQWFGDLVTCRDWGDVWLNESFATFFENLYTEHHLGLDEGAWERHEEGLAYKAEDRDQYRRRLSTRSWRGPEDLFDRHAYPKGALVLSMLRRVLGDAHFFAGIRLYLERNAYRAVETSDFRVAMEEATGQSLGWFFDEWLHSGGHPRFKVSSEWDPRERSVRVGVEQTQKVDDLTPLFRMPVLIAVTQPSGRTEHRVWISDRKQSFVFPAAERPRSVRFDPGDWILKDLELERSREDLIYQLERDPDMLGRREAAEALKRLAGDEAVETALLARLEAEPFWGVRVQVVASLEERRGEAVRRALVGRFGREPKSRARREIVRVLGAMGGAEALSLLRDAVARDPSYFVAADALRALGKAAKHDALPDALAALGRNSYEDVIREAAVDLLATSDAAPPEAQAENVKRMAALFRPGSSPSLRGAVLRGLGRAGKGSEEAFQLLTMALDDSSHFVRFQAIEALGELGDRRAIPALEARRAKEQPVVLRSPLAAIARAIERIEGKTDVKALEAEVRRLEERSSRLESRVDELERRGRTARF